MDTVTTSLIVPMDLAALCVGETDVNGSATNPYGTKDFSRLTPDFSLLPYSAEGVPHNKGPYTSDQVLAATFQSASEALDVGIHLHWALPDSLTRGAQSKAGSIGFPTAPNRWLVTRIATNTATAAAPITSMNSWVIESDRLWDDATEAGPMAAQNATSLDVPIQPNPMTDNNKSSMTLGRAFPYADWAEDPTAQRGTLTALGYGEATYAAAYQYCRNVFGFWDRLDDLDPVKFPPAATRVSYVLVGWHSNAADDPVAVIASDAKIDAAAKAAALAAAQNWVFAPDAAQSFPTRAVYNAVITDIAWDRGRHYLTQREAAPGTLDIAVGTTTAEALSALLAAQPDLRDQPNVEYVLNALQLGLLNRLSLPGGLTAIDESLHQADFASVSTGTLWSVAARSAGADEIVEVTSESMANASRNLMRLLPEDAGQALNTLNLTQQTRDRAALELDSLRARIFTDWYRYMAIEYGAPLGRGSGISPNGARDFIQAEMAVLSGQMSDLAKLDAAVQSQADALPALIGPDYVLSNSPAARFWHPGDPVVLFSGPDVKASYRYKPNEAQDEAGNLICRIGGNLMTAMRVDGGAFTVVRGQLPALAASPAIVFSDTLAALVAEAFFIDPVQAPVLAAAVAQIGGTGNPAVADFAAFAATVSAAQAALWSGADSAATIAFTGMPPTPVSFKAWDAPWIPIIMQWEVAHYPNALPPYATDFITKAYVLDDEDIDLTFKGTIPADPGNMRSYQGTIVLTHNTEINLKEQIATYIANYPDDDVDGELQDILDRIDLPMQAQALSGFNQAFLMLSRVMQMQVSDPLAILQGLFFARFTNEDVKTAVADQNVDAPLGNNTFGPIRNGGLQIARLRVVDAFGQTLDIEKPAVVRAASLIAPGDKSGLISLPVRLTQPAQLDFRWLSAKGDQVEMNSHPATTPVFGWVLYNHLDRSLVIYDGSGAALGSFNELGPFWQGAPGNAATYNQPIEQVFAGANPHLRNFALGISGAADPTGYLAEILRAINQSLTFISPRTYKQQKGLSVLIGRPLALVRAGLNLTLAGLPAMNQSMESFKSAIAGGAPLTRDEGGAPKVAVPVRLGDLSDIDDGMVGYFIDDGTLGAYQRFYSPASGAGDQHGVVYPGFDQVVLTADASAPRVVVSMLMDPHASVHAATGILPMKELVIPPDIFADDLAGMEVTFLSTPVLADGPPDMPVPDESGFGWSWVMQTADSGWTVTDIEPDTEAVTLTLRNAQEGWLKLRSTEKPKPEET